MEDRNKLKAYNDVVVSEEEIKKYENVKLSDDVLSKMKKRTKKLYKRANMEEAFEKVEEQFEAQEKVKYVFWGSTYGVSLAQNTAGCFAAPIGAAWTSWPTKTGVILTNKGIFGVETNSYYYAMKIKHFKVNEIEYIGIKRIKDICCTAFTIHPLKGEEIKLEMFNSDKRYMKFIKFIKDNNIKIDIRFIEQSTKDKIRFAIEIILLIILWGGFIIGTFSSLDFSRVLK